MNFLVLFIAFSTMALAGTPQENGKKAIHEVGMSMDLAEGNLRIVLNRPARSLKFPRSMITPARQLESAIYLMEFESEFPCVMDGKYGYTDWAQYEEVKRLFKELKKKYYFSPNFCRG